MGNKEGFEAVQRMQDYIAEHIHEPITLKALARAANFSPWHANRLFRELVGKTPFEYIRALRLTSAALRLRDSEAKVIDIALDFEFDTHEGFTRAFSKQFGMPPSRYRKDTPPVPLFIPYPIRQYYLSQIDKGGSRVSEKKTKTVFVQVIERPARILVHKRGFKATDYFAYCEEVGCDVWGVLSSIKEALYEPVGLWLPEKLIKEGISPYVQGVEVPLGYHKPLPEGFEAIELTPCKMMVFQSEPFEDDKFCEAIDEVWDVMKSYNRATAAISRPARCVRLRNSTTRPPANRRSCCTILCATGPRYTLVHFTLGHLYLARAKLRKHSSYLLLY